MINYDLPILIVDDEATWLETFSNVLTFSGFTNIVAINDPRNVMDTLKNQKFGLVLLDLWMPYIQGDELLEMIAAEYSYLPVIILTAADDIDMAVKCIKLGAINYLTKPLEKSQLVASVKQALTVRSLEIENEMLRLHYFSKDIKDSSFVKNIITNSESMFLIFKYIDAVSKTQEPILITGETGVGKEKIAESVHISSGLQGNFVKVNIAGLDDMAFSDTLFGHKKGAFTGAHSDREGLVKKAENGTLFLDEIGDLNPEAQTKLLRLIQEREYMPLGSDQTIKTTARVVVATNKLINDLQRDSMFRKDLFYRLNIHHVHVPPLRERKQDIPLLFNNFVKEICEQINKNIPSIPNELYVVLSNYSFPGNVRELRSMTYDVVTKNTTGKLNLDAFKEKMKTVNSDNNDYSNDILNVTSLEATTPSLKEIQDMYINRILELTDGNLSMAAPILGISRQALGQRVKKNKIK